MSWLKIIPWVAWAATLLLGGWLATQYGSVVMAIVLGLIALLVMLAHIWMARKAARARLEFQELIVGLAKGKTVDQLMAQHPNFLPKLKEWPDETIESILEVLDEKQAEDLRRILGRLQAWRQPQTLPSKMKM